MNEEDYSSDTTSSSESNGDIIETSDDIMDSSNVSMDSNGDRMIGFGFAFGHYFENSDESSSESDDYFLSLLPYDGCHHPITRSSLNFVVVHQTEETVLLALHTYQTIDDLDKKFSIKNNEPYKPSRYVKDKKVSTTIDDIKLLVTDPKIYTLYSLNELVVLKDALPAIPLSQLSSPGVYLITRCSKKVVKFMYLNDLSRLNQVHTTDSLKKSIERCGIAGGFGSDLLSDELRKEVLEATAEVRDRAREDEVVNSSASEVTPNPNSSDTFVHDQNCRFKDGFLESYRESLSTKPIFYNKAVNLLKVLATLPQRKNLVYYFTTPIRQEKKIVNARMKELVRDPKIIGFYNPNSSLETLVQTKRIDNITRSLITKLLKDLYSIVNNYKTFVTEGARENGETSQGGSFAPEWYAFRRAMLEANAALPSPSNTVIGSVTSTPENNNATNNVAFENDAVPLSRITRKRSASEAEAPYVPVDSITTSWMVPQKRKLDELERVISTSNLKKDGEIEILKLKMNNFEKILNLHTEIGDKEALRHEKEIAGLKQTISELKQGTAELKQGKAELKQNIVELKQNIVELMQENAIMRNEFNMFQHYIMMNAQNQSSPQYNNVSQT